MPGHAIPADELGGPRNGLIEPVSREEVEDDLLPGTREAFDEFYRCRGCGRIYWRGSHYDEMKKKVEELLDRS